MAILPKDASTARATLPKGVIVVPGKLPERTCGAAGQRGPCSRPAGHGGRHAFVWWGIGRARGWGGGIVMDVWDRRRGRAAA